LQRSSLIAPCPYRVRAQAPAALFPLRFGNEREKIALEDDLDIPAPYAAEWVRAQLVARYGVDVAALCAEIEDVFSSLSGATAGVAQSTSIGLILVSPSLVGVPLNLDQTPDVDAVALVYRAFT
jgi:hypothetical protein